MDPQYCNQIGWGSEVLPPKRRISASLPSTIYEMMWCCLMAGLASPQHLVSFLQNFMEFPPHPNCHFQRCDVCHQHLFGTHTKKQTSYVRQIKQFPQWWKSKGSNLILLYWSLMLSVHISSRLMQPFSDMHIQ